MKIVSEFYDADEPNVCCCDGCKEVLNALYYFKVQVGALYFHLNFCKKHADQFRKIFRMKE